MFGQKETHDPMTIYRLIFVTKSIHTELTLPVCWKGASQDNPIRV